jgi:ribosomal subunit interface protein
MEVTITARDCNITNATREKVFEQLHRLEKYAPRAATAQVRLEQDHGRRQVEARLDVPGTPRMVARSTGDTFGRALGASIDKLERQLQRRRGRRRQQRLARRDRQADGLAS